MNLDNNYPQVSILIPFYNHNKFIKKTLDSIKEDSYPNKEIIIINDGSSDLDDSNIVNWISKYKEQIIIKYIKRENKGLTKTLNELVKISRGKYLLPCASDDYLINNTIEDRIRLLEEVGDKNKLILISDNIVVNDNDKLIFNSNLFELRNVDKETLFSDDGLKYSIINQWSFAGPSWIANRKLFDEHNLYFDENLIVEDWDFFLRVIANNFALYYDKKVSAYRWSPINSKDSKFIEKLKNDLRQTALKNSELFEEPYKNWLIDYYNKKEPKKKFMNLIHNVNPLRWFRTRTKPVRYKLKRYIKEKLKLF